MDIKNRTFKNCSVLTLCFCLICQFFLHQEEGESTILSALFQGCNEHDPESMSS